MPTYMDRHDNVTVTPEELAGAHEMDVAVQAKHGVNYLSYWYDRDAECVFCFVDAPNKAAAEAVHKEAHGLTATKIIEVEGHVVTGFMGPMPANPLGEAHTEQATRTILFTDIVGSTDTTQRLGDAKAMELLRTHDLIVRAHLSGNNGSEVKHTGDGIMASFVSVSRAVECALAIQRSLEEHSSTAEHPIAVRIGVSAGEPVAEKDDLFGAAVQLAARACDRAASGSILVSSARARALHGQGLRVRRPRPVRAQGLRRARDPLRGSAG